MHLRWFDCIQAEQNAKHPCQADAVQPLQQEKLFHTKCNIFVELIIYTETMFIVVVCTVCVYDVVFIIVSIVIYKMFFFLTAV